MDNDHEFRQARQPHENMAGEWLGDAGGELLVEILPDSLGLLAVAVFIIVGIFWFVWYIGREIFGGPS